MEKKLNVECRCDDKITILDEVWVQTDCSDHHCGDCGFWAKVIEWGEGGAVKVGYHNLTGFYQTVWTERNRISKE